MSVLSKNPSFFKVQKVRLPLPWVINRWLSRGWKVQPLSSSCEYVTNNKIFWKVLFIWQLCEKSCLNVLSKQISKMLNKKKLIFCSLENKNGFSNWKMKIILLKIFSKSESFLFKNSKIAYYIIKKKENAISSSAK